MIEKFITSTAQETYELGGYIAGLIKPGAIVLVSGGLGAGKSVLIRGVISSMGVNENIPSPTFSLVNEYQGKILIYHFDLYRLREPYELYEIGFEDYIYSKGASFIEWPEKAGTLLPEDAIEINVKVLEEKREIIIKWNKN